MTIQKNDFIEIDFTGKITNTDEIFDTTVPEEAKKSGFKTEGIKPFVISVGNRMLPDGFDDDLAGKEEGKEYTLKLSPEKAFGKRDSNLVKMVPTKYFHEQQINPEKGMQLNIEGQIVKILSSDRDRTLTDFNKPLAGKDITYTYKINKIITDQKEKINAMQEFLFRTIFDYEIKEKTITFKIPKEAEQFVTMFASKFKEILDLEIKTEVVKKDKK